MNKNKISPELINDVCVETVSNKHVFVVAKNFDETKKFLIKNNYNFTPYRFANCFCVEANSADIKTFANKQFVTYISSNTLVQTENKESDFMHFSNFSQQQFLGNGQTICFIDTGIYPHLDFLFPKCRIVKFIDLINHKTFPYDDNGHGTFVAGICAGNGIFDFAKCGFAPNANIIMIKALDKNGTSESNTILDAMQWIFENHKVFNIGVVCLSLGADSLSKIDPLSQGAEALWKRGIVVVTAAGNSGPKNETIKSPGNNPYVITVGAMDVGLNKIADFSSRGPTFFGHKPDLVAPAVNVLSCSNSTPFYTLMSGTSVATPIVAGICASIKSKFPTLTNNQIKQLLKLNCTPITGEQDIEGAGLLNFLNPKF